MPQYAYRAKTSAAQVVEGTIEAESETVAITRLSARGVFPLAITERRAMRPQAAIRARGRRVPGRALADMSRQLADLLSGGLPLVNALSLLAQQTPQRALREVLLETSRAVQDGQALSDALSHHPEVFSPLYVHLVRAGEVGGGLDAPLTRLAGLLENEVELKSRVVSALVYPLVVLVIGAATIVVLLTYVVPKLALLFTETGQLLPLPTRLLLAVSATLSRGWWLGLALIGVLWWGLRRLRRSAAGGAMLDRLALRLPLGSTLVRKLETARVMRNLGVMVGQGVPVLPALEVAGAAVANAILRHAAEEARDAVRGGATLSQALTTTGQFPAFVHTMVAVGEEAGTLESALLKVASSYERDTDRLLRTLTTILEPALIVCVGLVVMFIVIAMLLPIFQLGLVVQ